jgi:hypothetical protein
VTAVLRLVRDDDGDGKDCTEPACRYCPKIENRSGPALLWIAAVLAVVVGSILLGKWFTPAANIAVSPAQAGPIQWCDPASPLFDPTICYNEAPSTGGSYACDPFGPAYDPDYCAAQNRS